MITTEHAHKVIAMARKGKEQGRPIIFAAADVEGYSTVYVRVGRARLESIGSSINGSSPASAFQSVQIVTGGNMRRSTESRCLGNRLLPGPRAGGLAKWQLQRVLEYIEGNLSSRLEIGDLANLIALSKSHFSRSFRNTLGLPPMAYVLTRRVERAKVMMKLRKGRLAQIALACGFADQSHLTRCFGTLVGVSPGRWRRINAAPREAYQLDKEFIRDLGNESIADADANILHRLFRPEEEHNPRAPEIR
jgi:transcriptional regulator GlxA family with amidase domain